MACADSHASDAGLAYTRRRERKRQRHVAGLGAISPGLSLDALTDGRSLEPFLCDPSYAIH